MSQCAKCSKSHRWMIPCESVGLERHACLYCRELPLTAMWTVGVPYERVDAKEYCQDYQCPFCKTTWTMRFQYDAGTGIDHVRWVKELGRIPALAATKERSDVRPD